MKYLSGLYGVSLEYLLDDGEDSPEERTMATAGTECRMLEKKPGKGNILRLTIAAMCIFALGAGAAFGFMRFESRKSSGDTAGEIGSRVYEGYTIKEPDRELIGGHVYGYAIIEQNNGVLVGMISNPVLSGQNYGY